MIKTEATCRGRKVLLVSTVCVVGLTLSACQSTSSSTHEELAPEDDAPIFSSSIFGVKASPRMTRSKTVPKGGGRDQTGKPYMVKGKWYYPKEEPGYVKSGTASWYGANFHGRLTANGEIYDMYHLSAAHPTFPLPSYARVTNRKTGASVMVRVNDRGPYVHDRVMDVSSRAAQLLGFQQDGIADVKVEYVGRAPLEGDDTKVLMASYHPGTVKPEDAGLSSGVMVASKSESVWPSFLTAAFSPRRQEQPAEVATKPLVRPVPKAVAKSAPKPSSIEDLIDTYDAATPPGVSMPKITMSYAKSLGLSSDAMRAIAAIAPNDAPSNRIEIGRVDDISQLMALENAAAGYGEIVEQKSAEGSSFALVVAEGQSIDVGLRRLWSAGFKDAFALRDE
ncbi:hypothetical protein M673_11380 [Aureimonas sp. AU20]|nr:hypothetical protein M673_11380 [Aureimonas sp. AU20]